MCETHILEPKNVGLYTWRRRGRGYEKVYCLYTHQNVDIFGRPLTIFSLCMFINIKGLVQFLFIDQLSQFKVPEKTEQGNYGLLVQHNSIDVSQYNI